MWSIITMGEGGWGGSKASTGVQATSDTREPFRWGEHGETVQRTEWPGGRVVVCGDFNLPAID